jgi:hypothetical protein
MIGRKNIEARSKTKNEILRKKNFSGIRLKKVPNFIKLFGRTDYKQDIIGLEFRFCAQIVHEPVVSGD